MTSASVVLWLQLIGLGAIVGAFGQGIRLIIGLKKVSDTATAQTSAGNPTSMADLVVGSRLLISFIIGAIAGIIAAATTITPGSVVSPEQIMGLAAAGYAGADFIEGFMSKADPSPVPAGPNAVVVPAAPGGGEAAAV
ncbi:MAG TPA: hypothetical protein VFW19_04560 [Allosphingosinicella sp.]|nr:hypothetical protein [Allosphingosinicella sp.]